MAHSDDSRQNSDSVKDCRQQGVLLHNSFEKVIASFHVVAYAKVLANFMRSFLWLDASHHIKAKSKMISFSRQFCQSLRQRFWIAFTLLPGRIRGIQRSNGMDWVEIATTSIC